MKLAIVDRVAGLCRRVVEFQPMKPSSFSIPRRIVQRAPEFRSMKLPPFFIARPLFAGVFWSYSR